MILDKILQFFKDEGILIILKENKAKWTARDIYFITIITKVVSWQGLLLLSVFLAVIQPLL